MSLHTLLGVDLTDEEIMMLIKQAYDRGQTTVKLPRGEAPVVLRLPTVGGEQ